MKKKRAKFRSDCPISTALDIFGDKWSLLIIRDMAFVGKSTYGNFLESGEHIATNILADRLAMLEWVGIIPRDKHPESKVKILYKLTPKGIDLLPVLAEIIIWSDKYYDVHPQGKIFSKQLVENKTAVLNRVRENLQKKAP